MESFSITEVIEQAVQTEKLGSGFYAEMAGRFSSNAELKGLFETLSLKERQHEKLFSGLRENAEQQIPEDWGEVSKYLRAIVESEFFLGNNRSLKSIEKIRTAPEAVRFAIGFEKETLLYYHNLRGLFNESALIDRIIKEEMGHIVWLSEYKKAFAGAV
ncbi:MAG: ferritin family protein [Nitrospirota bacterium]|nr:ferritin family protein [Nitrospirota bacterium]